MAPQDYAEAISAHSKLDTGSSLYPGHNFANLATHLLRPFSTHPAPIRGIISPSIQQNASRSLVTVYHLCSSGSKHIEQVQETGDIMRLTDAILRPEKPVASLVFMRGQVSSEWLSALGATYWVDPEFFQSHLEFRLTVGRLNYFPFALTPFIVP